jgi:hypothetical protein
MNYLKIYLKFFELEILFRSLTQMFTLTNKNKRRRSTNWYKNIFSLYTTTLFIVLGVINASEILYKQFNPSYHNSTLTLIV